MGTPLTSLQGWIERVRSRPTPPPDLADHLVGRRGAAGSGGAAVRAHRQPGASASRSASARWPTGWPATSGPGCRAAPTRSSSGSRHPARARRSLGDPVLLEWALEALVKNAIDALQGRSGTIILRVGAEQGMGEVRVIDDGPGVPREIRRDPVRARHHHQARRLGHRPGALPARRGGCPRGRAGPGADRQGSLFPDPHSRWPSRPDDRHARRPSCRVASIPPSGRRWSTSTGPCWCSPARGRARPACSPRASPA